MNGDATDPRPFFTTPSIAALAAAPDSRTIAYMSNVDGNWELYAVGMAGGAPTRLTNNAASDGLPAWSPDGQSLAFVSDRSGQWALWVMDADGSNERMLALLPGPVDGRVQFEPDYLNHGWLEEQIAWSW
jgi:dipeptidyl aminopeptidase/acylaminoacyl peptidase